MEKANQSQTLTRRNWAQTGLSIRPTDQTKTEVHREKTAHQSCSPVIQPQRGRVMQNSHLPSLFTGEAVNMRYSSDKPGNQKTTQKN